jgi:hypothetical protein
MVQLRGIILSGSRCLTHFADEFRLRACDKKTISVAPRKWSDDEKPLAVNKAGSVQGRLYRVGGKDETVPVRLEGANGETLHCEASTGIAQQLSALLFKQVRVSGCGAWERLPEGRWRLRKLKIESFQELDTAKASSVLVKLQSLGGLKWAEMDDPHGVAKDMRG